MIADLTPRPLLNAMRFDYKLETWISVKQYFPSVVLRAVQAGPIIHSRDFPQNQRLVSLITHRLQLVCVSLCFLWFNFSYS